MNVQLIDHTNDPKKILILSKNTRTLNESFSEFDLKYRNMSESEKEEQLKYVFGTVGSAWEFVDFIFLINDVTRAFTHQFVRHRHASFAQQSLRIVDLGDFGFNYPESKNKEKYEKIVDEISNFYNELLVGGEDIQDARGILPINTKTNILFKANLRTLSQLISERLCVRTQKEFREVATKLKKIVLEVFPEAEKLFRVSCLKNHKCPWENYSECPMKIKYPELNGIKKDTIDSAEIYFEEHMLNFNPQPKLKK